MQLQMRQPAPWRTGGSPGSVCFVVAGRHLAGSETSQWGDPLLHANMQCTQA